MQKMFYLIYMKKIYECLKKWKAQTKKVSVFLIFDIFISQKIVHILVQYSFKFLV